MKESTLKRLLTKHGFTYQVNEGAELFDIFGGQKRLICASRKNGGREVRLKFEFCDFGWKVSYLKLEGIKVILKNVQMETDINDFLKRQVFFLNPKVYTNNHEFGFYGTIRLNYRIKRRTADKVYDLMAKRCMELFSLTEEEVIEFLDSRVGRKMADGITFYIKNNIGGRLKLFPDSEIKSYFHWFQP